MHLTVSDLIKTFSGHVALERIDFDVREDEFVCLLGPSGCGKTGVAPVTPDTAPT
ncbi:hypothetical protein [Burkholderia gladioli]|uniref:hypothetical protein n=1 Tax=Burkholderia gladioli TaxID=28095 RepID=UPI001FC8370F|nr:hypothetical protein [Burkholderia gladioli]